MARLFSNKFRETETREGESANFVLWSSFLIADKKQKAATTGGFRSSLEEFLGSSVLIRVLVFVDLSAGFVLLFIQLPLLAFSQVPIVLGHIGLFLVFDVLFLTFDVRSLTRRHGAVLHAIRDAVLLVLLALVYFVDARMTGINYARACAASVAVLGLSSGCADHQSTRHKDEKRFPDFVCHA